MTSIGARLREERERLGLSQARLAELVGKSERSVVDWEKGHAAPNARDLERLGESQADVAYIVTGKRWGQGPRVEPVVLTAKERSLLEAYRNANDEGRRALEATGQALAYMQGVPGSSFVTIHGSVGQSVGRDVTINHNSSAPEPSKPARKKK